MKSLEYQEKFLLSRRYCAFLNLDYRFVYRQNVNLENLQLIGYDKTSTLTLLDGGANEMSLNQYKAWWLKEHHRDGLK